MNWTNEQKKAIDLRGGRIVVSAAAGSGKTAVLSERVINYIKKGGSLDKLLIVTFTKAAATDMKEKIRKKLKDANLEEQLMLVDSAKIMTMDSFYNMILTENALNIPINPTFEMFNENEYKIFKKNTMTSILEKNLETKYCNNFFDAKKFSIGEEFAIEMAEFLKKMPSPFKWFDNLISEYQKTDFSKSVLSDYFFNHLENIFKEYDNLYETYLTQIGQSEEAYNALNEFLTIEKKNLENITIAISEKNIEKMKRILKAEFKTYPSGSFSKEEAVVAMKNLRTIYKDDIKKTLKYLEDFENYSDVKKEQLEIVMELKKILENYFVTLQEKLQEKNLLGFDDIQNCVFQLLISDYNYEKNQITKTDYAKNLSNNFDEILIDEYQDTNLMQDVIFRSISNNDENIFIVGDIKQSIYKFRGSDPGVMLEKMNNSFKENFPRIITLDQNFRSRKEILDFVNYIFENLMQKNYGSLDYDDSHKLKNGMDFPKLNNSKINLTLIDYEDNKDDDTVYEKEASYIANQIRQLLDSDLIISKRKIKPSDIAILLRSTSGNAEIYLRALKKAGVPVYTESAPRYFEKYEIRLFISILKLVVKDDLISLYSIARSPLTEYDEVDLYNNRENPWNWFWSTEIGRTVLEFRDVSEKMHLVELVNYIFEKTEMLTIMSSMDDGENRFKNLLEMINHANMQVSQNIDDFVLKIESMIEESFDFEGTNPAPNEDSVIITSIHKSKGLEYPIVFLPKLNQEFNMKDLNKDFLIDKDLYTSFYIKKENMKTNLNFDIIKMKKRKEILEEEMRLFYVALTRAKEYLYMSSTVRKFENKLDKISVQNQESKLSYIYLNKCRSYLDFMIPSLLKVKEVGETFDLITKKILENFAFEFLDISEVQIDNDVKIESEIEYINLEELPLIKKEHREKRNISVSDLKESKFISNKKATNIGNIYHYIMENIQFKKYDFKSLTEEINNLVEKEEVEKIKIENILSFFTNSFFENTILNSKIKKEKTIYYFDKEKNYIINGVIDLLCIIDDKAYIIDYKSDLKTEKELLESYKKQLDLYEDSLKEKGYLEVYKYIYSFHLKTFIRV